MSFDTLHPRVRALWETYNSAGIGGIPEAKATLILASEVARLNDLLESCFARQAPGVPSMPGDPPVVINALRVQAPR